MNAYLLIWLVLFALLLVGSFIRPSWGVAIYMLSTFASPQKWWWGKSVGHHRWSLAAAAILLIAVFLSKMMQQSGEKKKVKGKLLGSTVGLLVNLIAVNATLVHFLLTEDTDISQKAYINLLKFVLLYHLIVSAGKTKKDFTIILLSLLIGAAYIGFEVTINDRGKMIKGRLEGVGTPTATTSNDLASLMVTILPLGGALFIAGRRWEKILTLLSIPFILNVLLLCNSRGGFLAAITSGIVFLFLSPKQVRKQAIFLIVLGVVAVFSMLGDSSILDRFTTIFAGEEKRDSSAQSRLVFWKVGLMVIADYPLGSGGDGYKLVHAQNYLRKVDIDVEARSVHNGYINEACEWGLQGLFLRIIFVISGVILSGRIAKKIAQDKEETDQEKINENKRAMLIRVSIVASISAFMISTIFGDFLDAEWGYWFVGLLVIFSRLYDTPTEMEAEKQRFPA